MDLSHETRTPFVQPPHASAWRAVTTSDAGAGPQMPAGKGKGTGWRDWMGACRGGAPCAQRSYGDDLLPKLDSPACLLKMRWVPQQGYTPC